MKAIKHDSNKAPLDLLLPDVEDGVARVFGHGARKYERYGYLRGTEWSRYYAAARRHMNDWWGGEDLDIGDSGLHHLDHAIACLMILRVYTLRKIGEDDRPK